MKRFAIFSAALFLSALLHAGSVRTSQGKIVRPGSPRSQSFKFGPGTAEISAPPTPPVTSGLIGHWEADHGLYKDNDCTVPATAADDTIGCWYNFAVSSNHMHVEATSREPTWKNSIISTHSAVLFDGTDDVLISSVTASDAKTVLVVMKTAGTLDSGIVFVAMESSRQDDLYVNGADAGAANGRVDRSLYKTSGAGNNANRTAAGQIVANTGYVMAQYSDGSSNPGAGDTTKNCSSLSIAGLATMTYNSTFKNSLGAYYNAGATYSLGNNFYVLEVLWYDSKLSAGNLSTVCSWLQSKYGL